MEQVSQAPSFNRRYFLLGSLLTCHLERPRVRHLTTNTRHYMYAVYHMVYALGDKDDSKCTYYYRDTCTCRFKCINIYYVNHNIVVDCMGALICKYLG